MFTKKIIANSFTKTCSVIKYKYFMEMIGIEDKKKLLTSIIKENNFRDIF